MRVTVNGEFQMQWRGSADPDVESGIAEITYSDINLSVEMPHFREFMKLQTMFKARYSDGVAHASRKILSAVNVAARRAEVEACA